MELDSVLASIVELLVCITFALVFLVMFYVSFRFRMLVDDMECMFLEHPVTKYISFSIFSGSQVLLLVMSFYYEPYSKDMKSLAIITMFLLYQLSVLCIRCATSKHKYYGVRLFILSIHTTWLKMTTDNIISRPGSVAINLDIDDCYKMRISYCLVSFVSLITIDATSDIMLACLNFIGFTERVNRIFG